MTNRLNKECYSIDIDGINDTKKILEIRTEAIWKCKSSYALKMFNKLNYPSVTRTKTGFELMFNTKKSGIIDRVLFASELDRILEDMNPSITVQTKRIEFEDSEHYNKSLDKRTAKLSRNEEIMRLYLRREKNIKLEKSKKRREERKNAKKRKNSKKTNK